MNYSNMEYIVPIENYDIDQCRLDTYKTCNQNDI